MKPISLLLILLITSCAEPPDAPPKVEKNPFSATVNAKPEPNKYQVHLVWEEVPETCQIFKVSDGQEALLTKLDKSSGSYDDEALKPKTTYIYKLVDDSSTTIHSVIVYIPEDLEIHGVIEAKAITANRLFLNHAKIFYQGELKIEAKELYSNTSEIRLLPPGPFSHLSEVSPAFRKEVNARLQNRFQDSAYPSNADPVGPDFNFIPNTPHNHWGNLLKDHDLSKYFKKPEAPTIPDEVRSPFAPIITDHGTSSRNARNAGVISIKAERAFGKLDIVANGDSGTDGGNGSEGLAGKQGVMGTQGLSKKVETTTTPAPSSTKKSAPKPNPITTVTFECAEIPTDGGSGSSGLAGSPGEDGKPGGDSAKIDVLVSEKTEFTVELHSEPGLGGRGGKGGPGGDGGPGGMAHPFPQMGCRQAKPGTQGPRGIDGRDGNDGKSGIKQPVNIKLGE